MERQKCTFKCEDNSIRLNCITNVYVKMRRQKCAFKWEDKSVRLNGRTNVYT